MRNYGEAQTTDLQHTNEGAELNAHVGLRGSVEVSRGDLELAGHGPCAVELHGVEEDAFEGLFSGLAGQGLGEGLIEGCGEGCGVYAWHHEYLTGGTR